MTRMEQNFRIYRRNLPHFRGRGQMFFVTWRLHVAQPPLTPSERDTIVSALKYFEKKRYVLWGYVVMDDHVHVLVLPEDDQTLEAICHSWKSYTANALHRTGRHCAVWQDESFDRIVRNEQELYEKMNYILNNPFKRWGELEKYPWCWCKGQHER